MDVVIVVKIEVALPKVVRGIRIRGVETRNRWTERAENLGILEEVILISFF